MSQSCVVFTSFLSKTDRSALFRLIQNIPDHTVPFVSGSCSHDHIADHLSFVIDKYGGGCCDDLHLFSDLSRQDQNRISHIQFRDDLFGFFLKIRIRFAVRGQQIGCQSDDLESPVLILLPQIDQVRDLLQTGGAADAPDVQQRGL